MQQVKLPVSFVNDVEFYDLTIFISTAAAAAAAAAAPKKPVRRGAKPQPGKRR
jgi:hypothetical protein